MFTQGTILASDNNATHIAKISFGGDYIRTELAITNSTYTEKFDLNYDRFTKPEFEAVVHHIIRWLSLNLSDYKKVEKKMTMMIKEYVEVLNRK